MAALADSGYEGAGTGILVPFKNPAGNQEPDAGARTRNALLRDMCCRGERGLALLTQRWAAVQHITADPDRTTQTTRAALVLTQFEHIHRLKLSEITSMCQDFGRRILGLKICAREFWAPNQSLWFTGLKLHYCALRYP